jgi:hypothetical protein
LTRAGQRCSLPVGSHTFGSKHGLVATGSAALRPAHMQDVFSSPMACRTDGSAFA